MSTPSNEPAKPRQPLGSDSHGTIDLVYDGPGEKTTGPRSPALLEFLRAEREKFRRYGMPGAPKADPAPPSENPTDTP